MGVQRRGFRPHRKHRIRSGRLGFWIVMVLLLCGATVLTVSAGNRAGGLWSDLPTEMPESSGRVEEGFLIVDVSSTLKADIAEAAEKTAPAMSLVQGLGIGPLPDAPSLNDEEVILQEVPGAPAGQEPVEPVSADAAAAKHPWTVHTVADGETLSEIAERYKISVKSLSVANEIKDPDSLLGGQRILVPNTDSDVLAVLQEVRRLKKLELDRQKQAKLLIIANYTVKTGDSLWSIANAFNLDINTIFGCNTIKNPDALKVGMVLRIPNQDGVLYKVRRKDTVAGIAKRFGSFPEAILSANGMTSEKELAAGKEIFVPGAKPLEETREEAPKSRKRIGRVEVSVPSGAAYSRSFRWPVVGKINSRFGWRGDPFSGRRDFHTGLDIKGPTGRAIVAAKSGVVAYAGWMSGYGRTVVVDHGGGYTTLYAHCSRLMVHSGARVQQGQTVAAVGSTGRSTGSHLHFEVRVNGRPINPLKVLR
jgi:murein DD-endopeptidase MepM/ murein hydrolase activator NlpD